MNTRRIIRSCTVAAIAATVLNASPAAAQLGTASIECRAAVAKNYGKLLKSANKVIAGCHKSRDKDVTLVGTDCNDLAVADLAKGKYLKASDKFSDAVVDNCPSQAGVLTAANVGGGTEYYISCPVVPCAGVTGVINSMVELADCLTCEAAAIAEDVATATLGLPNPADLNEDEQKCHGAIAKGYGKYLSTGHKNDTACQGAADELGDNTLTSCFNTPAADPKDKTAGALTKAGEGLAKACVPAVNFADLDGCSTVDLASVEACNDTLWADAEDDAFTTTYELPATGCPNAIRTTILGGCSTEGAAAGVCINGFQSGTSLSVGWKGLAHGVDITDRYTLGVDLVCGGTDKGSCTSSPLCAGGDTAAPDFAGACASNVDCTLGNTCQNACVSTGISLDNPQYNDFTRCLDDTARACDEPFTYDLDCGSCAGGVNIGDDCTSDGDCPASTCTAGACRYFLGPPLAVSASGTPTCTLNVVNTDIVGGIGDPDLGTADFLIDLRAVVHLGLSQERPCPYCRNDPAPQDGDRNGICTGGDNAGAPCISDLTCTGAGGDCSGNFGSCHDGAHDGDPCDVQGWDLSFANPQQVDVPDDGNSLDCPPNSGANISGGGLAIALPLTTGVSSKDAVDECESPLGALDCFCGVCSGDSNVSCDSDTDCSDLLLGTCGIGTGINRQPNLCTDGICTAVSSDRGECQTSMPTPDIDSYCSGMLFANGKGVISCGVDSDCEAYETGLMVEDDWVCPFDDCGTCTVATYRSCFNDPMSLTGTPDPVNPILVGTFCLPPSSNGSVNSSTGSPGPGSVQADSLIELRY